MSKLFTDFFGKRDDFHSHRYSIGAPSKRIRKKS
jgi:hypothetical protein